MHTTTASSPCCLPLLGARPRMPCSALPCSHCRRACHLCTPKGQEGLHSGPPLRRAGQNGCGTGVRLCLQGCFILWPQRCGRAKGCRLILGTRSRPLHSVHSNACRERTSRLCLAETELVGQKGLQQQGLQLEPGAGQMAGHKAEHICAWSWSSGLASAEARQACVGAQTSVMVVPATALTRELRHSGNPFALHCNISRSPSDHINCCTRCSERS